MGSIFGSFHLPVPEAEQVEMYSLIKASLTEVDDTVLATVQTPKQGDIAVVDTVIEDVNYGKTAYMYDDGKWVALNGNVDADKVILTSDIKMAGNYTQVGNLTKSQTGTATFATKGKSVADALTEIFSKRLQPTITAQPSLGAVNISKAGAVEVGTELTNIAVTAVTFNAGSYTYGPATGVTANAWETTRISNKGNDTLTGVIAGGAVTDAGPFVIGDQTGDYSSLQYRVKATYGNGVVANDNLGSASSPEVKIAAGSCQKDSAKITCYRNFFYGATAERPAEVNSAYIRGLTKSNKACSNGAAFTITIPDGATTVVIAYPATFHDLTLVKDVNAMGSPLTDEFKAGLMTVAVEGANGYTAIDYKVYVYKPAASLSANTYEVTI